ncbi:CubicO group peptidase, beta-lactamase class C family [Pseudarcicella hirudinis]|uniref:CubicO group peptidase, beta-lactamase class C family n=1 Tax=Pseudarcicella hirudinis TaxID=1079859 RepID=A0A1I5YJM8_9BACT|nr:serine hydrolase domain-containing protein [Pseudarcicella hirudinis]SFQ44436.1 CubicO group peptidase, beta-lactamase class C family [Pseudarcicella hirudinis]
MKILQITKFVSATTFLFFLGIISCSHQQKSLSDIPTGPVDVRNDSLNNLFDPKVAARKAAKLDTFFKKLHRTGGFNGVVLVSQFGKIIYKGAFGFANFSHRDSLSVDTPFQLASVSKQFTAVAIMQLKEKGLLNYDDPVWKHIPNFPYDSSITIRSLLTHSSGIPNYIYALDRVFNKKNPITNQEVVDLFARYRPGINYLPNSRFNYNNSNYVLLAYIVEKLSGMNFRQYARKNLFEPAGMTHSFIYDPMHPEQVAGAAVGYSPRRRGYWQVPFDHLDGAVGDKGVYSTVEDLYKWDMALNSEKLVKLSTLDDAFQPAHSFRNLITKNYGFGWRLQLMDDGSWLTFHTGWWHGFKNYYLHNHRDNSAIIVLGNVASHYLGRIKVAQSILYPEKAWYFMSGESLPNELDSE